MDNEASEPIKESDHLPVTEKTRELTDKNVLFLHHLKMGLSTVEAYEKAGYQGNSHAAYELRSYLKNEIAKMLNGEGFGTREGLLLKLKKLQDLPVVQTGLTVKEAVELLKLEAKLQPKEAREAKPNITPIVINVHAPASVQAVEGSKTVDVTPIEIREANQTPE
jgi:hypothetical protein